MTNLAALHECRTGADLDRLFAAELGELLPDTDAVVCTQEAEGREVVRLAVGSRWQAAVGQTFAERSATSLPISFRGHDIGRLVVERALSDDEAARVAEALAHYGTALANQTLWLEAQHDADDYFAILQALEQGIVLFQEEDPEAIKARLLHQAMSIVGASAGALFVLREMGDATSGLALEQVLGIPDAVVAGFRGQDGVAWPDVLLPQPSHVTEREPDGSLAMLAPEHVPEVLKSMAVVPLRYHGVDTGLCLLFNPQTGTTLPREVGARLQSFGLLGAALLHRLRLEAIHAVNRSRERELQIARTIQQRLLPSAAPVTPGFTYAWVLLTAQNIGGDYLDVFEARPGSVRGIVADASGHGINSAMLMSSFRATYRAKAADTASHTLAELLNDVVCEEVGPTGMFITAVVYELDCATRRLRMTSAGHTPSMLFRAATGTVERGDSDGPPLGFLAGVDYESRSLQLESGDVLLLYTDGITEAANADLDMYGEDRLAAVLARHASGTATALLQAVQHDVEQFCGRERFEDDVSLSVVRVD